MPTYEYRCNKCGKTFDVSQNMSAKALTVCPDKKCKGKIKRLISAGAGFIFKGSGFYATDYRSEGYKKRAKEEMPGSSKRGTCDKKQGSCPIDK